MSLKEYNERFQATPADRIQEINGLSPGGAAARLGITRQAVHNAIKRDKLHAYRLRAGGKVVAIIIPTADIEHYRRNHLRGTG